MTVLGMLKHWWQGISGPPALTSPPEIPHARHTATQLDADEWAVRERIRRLSQKMYDLEQLSKRGKD